MTDIYRDDSGDIWLSGTGVPRLAAGDEETMQRIRTRLRRWAGEWTFDPSLGVPYRRDVLIKNPDMRVVRSAITTEIEQDPGVARVVDVVLELDKEVRHLEARVSVLLVDTGIPITVEAALYPLAADDGDIAELDDGTLLVP